MADIPTATFDHNAYVVSNFAEAKQATVGDISFDDGSCITSDARWNYDTVYTLDVIGHFFSPPSEAVVLDYGCGSGRISKGLIERFGCKAIGYDQSASMREVARGYVNSPQFLVRDLTQLLSSGITYDLALCLWVLQHSYNPRLDAEQIFSVLKPRSYLLVFNEQARYVPTVEYGFVQDGVSVLGCLEAVFGEPIKIGRFDPKRMTQKFADRTFWAIYHKG